MSSEEPVWVVPESLRPRLAERYGPVYSGREADRRLLELGVFGACGDVVTAEAVRLRKLPLVAVVDFKTERDEPVDPESFAPLARRRRIRVMNPPGMLTESLRRAVRQLVRTGGGLIEVEGEEDLGSLALVEEFPFGTTVIYGIPGAGVSFVPVNARTKEHARALIAEMEMRRMTVGP